MGDFPHASTDRPRDRLKHFLRRRYRGPGQAKALAADMSSTVKAAENVLEGHWPSELHLAAIVRRFGKDLWDAVFAPEIEPVLARLSQEERELEEALERVRAHRRQAGGDRDSDAQPLAPTDGAARAR